MMMTADTLKLLQDTAQQAQTAKELNVPGDGRKKFFQIGPKLETITVAPPARSHRVFTLDDLIRFAESLGEDVQNRPKTLPIIFHSPERVVLLFDADDRRDSVTLPLKFADTFAILQRLDQQTSPMDQKTFCRLLQFQLGVDKATVSHFRNLDWNTQVAVKGESVAGRDRLGREVLATVKGATELPEEIVIGTAVYSTQGERESRSVRCAVEMETATQRLILMPFPLEIATMIDAAQASIHDRLTEQLPDVPVYYGEAS